MEYDVVVVGSGNAGLCAALSARERGARVLLLEKAAEAERGGNSSFTAGAFRFPHRGLADIREIIPDLAAEELAAVQLEPYSEAEFFEDIVRLSEYFSDPDLVDTLVREAQPTVRWMRDRGVRWGLMLGRQAFRVEERFRFWGGLAHPRSGSDRRPTNKDKSMVT